MCTRVIKIFKRRTRVKLFNQIDQTVRKTYIFAYMYTQLRPQAVISKSLKAKQAETTAPLRILRSPLIAISSFSYFLSQLFFTLSWPYRSLGDLQFLRLPFYPPFRCFPPLSRSALHVSDSITTTQRANTGSILPVLPG